MKSELTDKDKAILLLGGIINHFDQTAPKFKNGLVPTTHSTINHRAQLLELSKKVNHAT
jgi:hypothetical protein